MHLTNKDILDLEKVRRLNIINSVSGIKSANLIGSISNENQSNLAIFSSVIHLGSNPALFGFITRPVEEVPRHTFENILSNKCYTINAIPGHLVKNAHYTSGKFDRNISEFERCAIQEEFLPGFPAPFVKDSPIKMGLSLQEVVSIPLNGTKMVIGMVEHLIVPDHFIDDRGYLDLAGAGVVGIGGLNRYYQIEHQEEHPYVRTHEVPELSS